MKTNFHFILSLLTLGLSLTQTHAETASSAGIRWICSTEKSRWQELAPANAAGVAGADAIKLDPKTTLVSVWRCPTGCSRGGLSD